MLDNRLAGHPKPVFMLFPPCLVMGAAADTPARRPNGVIYATAAQPVEHRTRRYAAGVCMRMPTAPASCDVDSHRHPPAPRDRKRQMCVQQKPMIAADLYGPLARRSSGLQRNAGRGLEIGGE